MNPSHVPDDARANPVSEPSGQRAEREGPPPFDPEAVSRVAPHVQILSVELLGANFDRAEQGPLPGEPAGDEPPALGIGGIEWDWSREQGTFGCVINFSADFEDERGPYELLARFRLLYSLPAEAEIEAADLEQFAHWNCVFNAWPYWREYLASTLNRAQLPRFTVPVLGMPRAD